MYSDQCIIKKIFDQDFTNYIAENFKKFSSKKGLNQKKILDEYQESINSLCKKGYIEYSDYGRWRCPKGALSYSNIKKIVMYTNRNKKKYGNH